MIRKTHLVIGALIVSVLLNAAGIVFFVLYLQTASHLKSVKREKNNFVQNLALLKGQNKVNEILHSDQVIKSTFVSHFDGQEDSFAVLPPRSPKPEAGYDMIVYLHGMGSTFLEPFVTPESAPISKRICDSHPDLIFASLNYRRAWSWGNDAAIADITQNIRELMQRYPVNRIILIGTSMGGCTSLTYTALAPDDVKAKIIGAVSVEGAGDLARLFHETKNTSIPNALINAFGGRPEAVPERYAKQSFLSNIEQLKGHMRFAIISATRDTIVPPSFQQELMTVLKNRNLEAHLIEVNSGHGIPPAEYYSEGLDFVLGKQPG
jgi:predicted esterase